MNDLYNKTWYDDEMIVVYYIAKDIAYINKIYGEEYIELSEICFKIYNDTSEKHLKKIFQIMDRIIKTKDSIFTYATADKQIFTFKNVHIVHYNNLYEQYRSLVYDILNTLSILKANPFSYTAFFIKYIYLMDNNGYIISSIEKIARRTHTQIFKTYDYIELLKKLDCLREIFCEIHSEDKCSFKKDKIYYIPMMEEIANYTATCILD